MGDSLSLWVDQKSSTKAFEIDPVMELTLFNTESCNQTPLTLQDHFHVLTILRKHLRSWFFAWVSLRLRPLPPITAYTSILSAFLPRSMVFRSHLPITQYRTLMMHSRVTVLLHYRTHFSCIDECSSFVVGAREYLNRASIHTDMRPCRNTRWVVIMITSTLSHPPVSSLANDP